MTSQTLYHLTNPSNSYYLSTNENHIGKVLMNIVVDPRISGRYGRGRSFNERDGKGNNYHFSTYYGRNNHTVYTCYQNMVSHEVTNSSKE